MTGLLLESKDMSDTAVDRVPEPSLRLVADRNHRIEPLVNRDMRQQLWHITRPENLVHGRKVRRALLGVEVGRKDAPRDALPPEELARPAGARGPRRGGRGARGGGASRVCGAHHVVVGEKYWKFLKEGK